jgi:hypothetical protein
MRRRIKLRGGFNEQYAPLSRRGTPSIAIMAKDFHVREVSRAHG